MLSKVGRFSSRQRDNWYYFVQTYSDATTYTTTPSTIHNKWTQLEHLVECKISCYTKSL